MYFIVSKPRHSHVYLHSYCLKYLRSGDITYRALPCSGNRFRESMPVLYVHSAYGIPVVWTTSLILTFLLRSGLPP